MSRSSDEAEPISDDHSRLIAWIESELDARAEAELERLDLRAFLQASAGFDVPPEERLRRLAIALERRVCFDRAMRDWAALDRVYAHALQLRPEEPSLHASRSISASRLAEDAGDPGDVERLVRMSGESLQRALALDPDDAELRYLDGYHRYLHRVGSTEDALAALDRALELDGAHGFARLYRAHCLHDLGRFEEAVAAYDEVPRDAFEGPTRWRMDLLVEQRAQCRARAGDLDGARAELEAALARYEREPHLAADTTPRYRRWAAETFPGLAERVDALEARIASLPLDV